MLPKLVDVEPTTLKWAVADRKFGNMQQEIDDNKTHLNFHGDNLDRLERTIVEHDGHRAAYHFALTRRIDGVVRANRNDNMERSQNYAAHFGDINTQLDNIRDQQLTLTEEHRALACQQRAMDTRLEQAEQDLAQQQAMEDRLQQVEQGLGRALQRLSNLEQCVAPLKSTITDMRQACTDNSSRKPSPRLPLPREAKADKEGAMLTSLSACLERLSFLEQRLDRHDLALNGQGAGSQK